MTNTDETATRKTEPVVDAGLSRRVMLRGATLGGLSLPLLAACGGGDDTSGSASDPSAEASSPAASDGPGAAAGGTTVAAADVPVGGGTILAAEKVVVTQPTKGEFKAFSAICTHKGCPVSEIADAEIVCKCHGSHFSITDGSPTSGPASAPLAAKKATVKGTEITVT